MQNLTCNFRLSISKVKSEVVGGKKHKSYGSAANIFITFVINMNLIIQGHIICSSKFKDKKYFISQIVKVMKMLKTLHEHKRKTERFKMRERAAEHEKKMKKIDVRREKKHKEVKKNIYRALGQLEKKQQKYNKD